MTPMPWTDAVRRSTARLLIAVALVVQFSPFLHAAASHSHDTSSCTHTEPRIHFEASASGGNETPCIICAHLINRQAPAPPPSIVCEVTSLLAPSVPPPSTRPDPPDLQIPGNRGPPIAL